MPRSNRCRETDSYKINQVCFNSGSFKMKNPTKIRGLRDIAPGHKKEKEWEKYLAAHIGRLECPPIASSTSAIFGFPFSNQVLTPYYYRAHWVRLATDQCKNLQCTYFLLSWAPGNEALLPCSFMHVYVPDSNCSTCFECLAFLENSWKILCWDDVVKNTSLSRIIYASPPIYVGLI